MKKYGLSKTERIKKRRDFERVLKNGIKRHNKSITLSILDNQLSHNRLGIIVSKKLVKKAAKRNLLKRLVREAFRLNKQQLPKGVDMIINLKKTEDISLEGIGNSLLRLSARVQL